MARGPLPYRHSPTASRLASAIQPRERTQRDLHAPELRNEPVNRCWLNCHFELSGGSKSIIGPRLRQKRNPQDAVPRSIDCPQGDARAPTRVLRVESTQFNFFTVAARAREASKCGSNLLGFFRRDLERGNALERTAGSRNPQVDTVIIPADHFDPQASSHSAFHPQVWFIARSHLRAPPTPDGKQPALGSKQAEDPPEPSKPASANTYLICGANARQV